MKPPSPNLARRAADWGYRYPKDRGDLGVAGVFRSRLSVEVPQKRKPPSFYAREKDLQAALDEHFGKAIPGRSKQPRITDRKTVLSRLLNIELMGVAHKTPTEARGCG